MTYIQSERSTRNRSMEIGENTDKALLVMAGQASTPGTWANNTVFSSYWFSIPYAYAQSGWLLGTLFLLITLGSSWITGLIYGSIINDRYDILLSKRNRELNAIYTRKIEVPLGMRETPIMCHGKFNTTTGPTRGAIMRDEKEVVGKETKSETLPSATPLDVLTTEVYAKDVTLADLYRDLMGRAGPVIGDIICLFNYVPATAGELILCGQLLQLLFPNTLDIGYWILIVSFYAFFAYMIPNLETLEKFSWIFGMFLISSAILMMVAGFESKISDEPAASSEYGNQNTLSVFNGLGVFSFAFGGHSTFPTQISEMRRPKQWNTMFHFSWMFVTVILFATGIVGFFSYGSAVNDVIFYSMQPGNVQIAATVLGGLYALYTIPLWINVLFQVFERRMGIPTHVHFSDQVDFFGISITPFLARLIFRTAILLFQVLIALALPYDFGFIQALVGSCSIALGTFLLPPLMYLKFMKKELGFATQIMLWVLVLFGSVLFFAGTTVAIINIVDSISTFSVFSGF